jgi:acyl-CoA synthetase (AMP-forming)/AMP-acid ligase II
VTLQGLLDDLERSAAARPEAPAFIDRHGRAVLSHGILARRIDERAGALAAAGLVPGDRVAFGVRPNPDGFAWLLACFRAGIAVVVLDPGVAAELLVARARAAGVGAVLLDPVAYSLASNGLGRRLAGRFGVRLPDPRLLGDRVLVTGPTFARVVVRVDRLARTAPGAGWDAEAAALVVFTSGTTGAPRGVVHTPRSIVANLTAVRDLADLTPDARVFATAPNLVVPTLLAGGSVVIPPRRDADLPRVTRSQAITHLSLAPHRAVGWAEAGGAPSSLRRLFLGTAPLRTAALRRILPALPAGAQTWGVYGLTEMLLVTAITGEERCAHDERDGDLVGSPIAGARIRVADDGEVRIGGPGLARGYLGERPVDELGTGDIGRLDAGRLVLLGRRKEMLIRRGENIYPSLYEPALVERAGLAEAALVGVPDELGDERAVLWIVPAAGERAGGQADAALARVERLLSGPDTPFDAHARPDAILVLDRLPRAGRSDKVDRRALVTLAAGRLGLAEPRDPSLPEPR